MPPTCRSTAEGARAGGINAMLEMADNNTKSHISEFPIGTYKKAHRHGPGAIWYSSAAPAAIH